MSVQELEKLKQISNVIKQSVQAEKIYLFGSYAYGTPNTDSDFDICVIIPDNAIRPVDAIKTIRRALPYPRHPYRPPSLQKYRFSQAPTSCIT